MECWTGTRMMSDGGALWWIRLGAGSMLRYDRMKCSMSGPALCPAYLWPGADGQLGRRAGDLDHQDAVGARLV